MSRQMLHIAQQDLLCKNGCGYYGNRQWDGYCSKCYRELVSKKGRRSNTSARASSAASSSARAKLSQNVSTNHRPEGASVHACNNKSLHHPAGEDAKKVSKMTFFKKAKNKNSSGVSPSSSSSSLMSEESELVTRQMSDFLAAHCCSSAADHVKRQLQTCMDHCVNVADTASIVEDMAEIVQQFYSSFCDRVHNTAAYHGLSDEHRQTLCDLAERLITCRLYSRLFQPLSQRLEDDDIQLQSLIRSLHWVTAAQLDIEWHESDSATRSLLDSAITALIEMDSKRVPQDKLECISTAVNQLLQLLRATARRPDTHDLDDPGSLTSHRPAPPSADDLLPAVIFTVLRSNPPRLRSNIQFITLFSSPQRIMSGEQAYHFTNLCCAVSFISDINHDSLGLTVDEFQRYMSGDALPPLSDQDSQPLSQGLRTLQSSHALLESLTSRQAALDQQMEQFSQLMTSFQEHVDASVSAALSQCPATTPARAASSLPPPGSSPDDPSVTTSPVTSLVVCDDVTDTSSSCMLPVVPSQLLCEAQSSLNSLLAVCGGGAGGRLARASSGPMSLPAYTPHSSSTPTPTPAAATVSAALTASHVPVRQIPSIACSTGARLGHTRSSSLVQPISGSTSTRRRNSLTEQVSCDVAASLTRHQHDTAKSESVADSSCSRADVQETGGRGVTASSSSTSSSLAHSRDERAAPSNSRQSEDRLVKMLSGVMSVTDLL